MPPEPTILIRPDRISVFERRHPWVFGGAVQSVHGDPDDGEIVTLRTGEGKFLARGYWNSRSQIKVHILTWDEAEAIDETFWRARLVRAVRARDLLPQSEQPGIRLVNAESDGLPGLIVDRYGDYLVLQALTLGLDLRKVEVVELLMDLLPGIKGIYERSDVEIRAREGLRFSTGLLVGEEPPPLIPIIEGARRFLVDVRTGHKTGFYLDQRPNREKLATWTANYAPPGALPTLLNCFSYTGGFSVHVRGTWHVINVDSSAEALALARQNMALNGFAVPDESFVEGDVFTVLRQYRNEGRQFDIIVLDPPKFAHARAQVEKACRGYKDINLLAFQLIRPGGLLMTFSCSGLVDADLFQKVIFGALVDSGRQASILERLTAGPDHPVALTFPEGYYLKGLLCRVW